MSLEMFNDIFSGEAVSLFDMLNARDERYEKQNALLVQFPGRSLLVVTMNIPGDVKNSGPIAEVFESAVSLVDQLLAPYSVEHVSTLKEKTGNEAYYVVDIPARELKRLMLEVEEGHAQGRLFDLDVLYIAEDEGESAVRKVSRGDFEIEPRRCFVCDKDAKACARSRAHTTDEMKEAIAKLIENQ